MFCHKSYGALAALAICQPSVASTVVLLRLYVARETDVHGVTEEPVVVVRQPSAVPDDVLLSAYSAAVTLVQLPLNPPLRIMRKPSAPESPSVMLALSY